MKGKGLGVKPLIAGVRSDIETFLLKYRQISKGDEEKRYKPFNQLFKDMKMTAIFTGRINEAELRELSEKMFSMIVSYIVPMDSVSPSSDRFAALYLLYGLYYRQPVQYSYRIRVTPDQLNALNDFMDNVLKPISHLDAAYALWKLIDDRAFVVTFSTDDHNPIISKAYDTMLDVDQSNQYNSGLDAQRDHLKESISGSIAQQLIAIDKIYVEHREKITERLNINRDMYFVDAGSGPGKLFKNVYDNYALQLAKKSTETKTTKKSPVKNRRANLKQNAYGSVAVQGRNRRHRQQIVSSQIDNSNVEDVDRDRDTEQLEEVVEKEENETIFSKDQSGLRLRVSAVSKKPRKKLPKSGEKKGQKKTVGFKSPQKSAVEVPKKRGKNIARVMAPSKKAKLIKDEKEDENDEEETHERSRRSRRLGADKEDIQDSEMDVAVMRKKRVSSSKQPAKNPLPSAIRTKGTVGRPPMHKKLLSKNEQDVIVDRELALLMKGRRNGQ